MKAGRVRRERGANHPSSFIPHPFWFVALLAAFTLTCSRAERPARHYNLLLITLDTFRADRLGAQTPNLTALARSGVQFARVSSPVPLTLPAHASMLSSTLPLHHGLRNNGAGSFPADRDTLATLLAGAGYRTGAFVSAFVLDHRFGLNRGFETYDDELVRDPNANASTYDAERRGGDTIDRALAWLQHRDARPWFAWVHLYDAHAPYAPPAPYPRTYDGEIAYVDAQVGRLLATIDRSNTVIAIVGDHGEGLGEHGELTHGLLLYEPTLHVPLVVAAPDAKPHVINEAISSVDLGATLAALCGTPFAAKLDGRDLSASITGTTEPAPAELYAETEYPALFGWSDLAAMRRGNIKYIASTSPELYDLAKDPAEAHNALGDERRAYRDLSAKLTSLRDAAKASGPKAQPSPLDDEAKAKLASLGYIAPTSLVNGGGPRPDPAAMAPLFRTFEEATWATNEGRLADAIRMLGPIVARDPRNPVFRSTLARALRQQGNARAAIKLNEEAVALAPQDAEAWYNLGVTFAEAGMQKESFDALSHAVRLDPARPEAHNALGIALMEQSQWDAAKGEFRKALEIDPRDARAYNNLGNIDRATGALDAAAASYRKALELAPDYADALNGLGAVEVQRDQTKAAIAHFDRALQVAPHFYEAQLNRGIALQLLGDKAGAAAQFRKLLAELPNGREFDAQRKAATQLLTGLNRS